MLPTGFPEMVKRLGGLAIVLAALLFAVGGKAEAAEHGHHHDAQVQTQAAGHHHGAETPAPAEHEHKDGGIHHDGGCHCMSAACVPVLPSFVSDYRVFMPRSRHALPGAMDMMALAGVDPPAEPPRI